MSQDRPSTGDAVADGRMRGHQAASRSRSRFEPVAGVAELRCWHPAYANSNSSSTLHPRSVSSLTIRARRCDQKTATSWRSLTSNRRPRPRAGMKSNGVRDEVRVSDRQRIEHGEDHELRARHPKLGEGPRGGPLGVLEARPPGRGSPLHDPNATSGTERVTVHEEIALAPAVDSPSLSPAVTCRRASQPTSSAGGRCTPVYDDRRRSVDQ